MKSKKSTKIIVAGVLLLLVLSASCSQNVSTDQGNNNNQLVNNNVPIKTYWIEEQGITHTNEYLKLQQVLPFKLVLPKTIPDELKQYPPQFRKYSNSQQISMGTTLVEENIIEVEIDYQSFSGDYRAVQIWENNSTSPLHDQDHFENWVFNGVQIQEQTSIDKDLSQNIKKEVKLSKYFWYSQNLRFQTFIWGYSQDESRKIVESMFK
jgi:hypothetical protein